MQTVAGLSGPRRFVVFVQDGVVNARRRIAAHVVTVVCDRGGRLLVGIGHGARREVSPDWIPPIIFEAVLTLFGIFQ